ncbi:TIR domain-containing protein [Acinetobacter sp. YH12134]|uniref:TIR domain-containing protein n=1 Tax=Acinetobacter sp. YH12134 TaxID=2601118 RepID=UPI001C5519F5|nr:TIR domain-containing protein [Acinetobacter sp. YH12134]
MTNIITPPLAAHFIWHKSDQEEFNLVCGEFRSYLTRDIDRPFSRELNIPTFFYTSFESVPSQPNYLAQNNVVFICLSRNTLGSVIWRNFLNTFLVNANTFIVPIALDEYGLNHSTDHGNLHNLNFIRAFNFEEDNKKLLSILHLSHELYRYGFQEHESSGIGSNTSIRLFLSHAKKGGIGEIYAKAIKDFINLTNMKEFFDASEISVGYRFDQEIINHIHHSTLIAITTDEYSSRYWCQREILEAKKNNRPIISVNCLKEYEDRIFPPAANVPCVHITPSEVPPKHEILTILVAALIETIRFNFSIKLLNYYQMQSWIDSNAVLLARPPEIQTAILLKQNIQDDQELSICYPEPPIYAEEMDWTKYLNIKVSTPLWNSEEEQNLNKKIGVSISEDGDNDFIKRNTHPDELKRLSQELARHLLVRGNSLIYGGDLRPNGFTEFIVEEASILQNRLPDRKFLVRNHLSWPLWLDNKTEEWGLNHFKVLEQIKYELPDDIQHTVDNSVFLPFQSIENKYIWSRCLTLMREKTVQESEIRICAGGKTTDYKGKMPGVLEEFLIALASNKPIYLIGGLGGIVKDICESIKTQIISPTLTQAWQIEANEEYEDLLSILESSGHGVNYTDIGNILTSIEINDLAKNVGLTSEEYIKLMDTPFIDEIIHLILKGLKNL